MEMKQAVDAIWRGRAKAYRQEISPYLRYMAQSGFPSFLSLLFISAAIGYISLIRDYPHNFPLTAVGVLALTPVISWSPLRTYIVDADIIYLMPREREMGTYLYAAFRSSILYSTLVATIVFLLYIPLYIKAESPSGPWLLAAAAILTKGGNAAGSWVERGFSWRLARWFYRMLRWLLTGAVLAAWLKTPVWQAASFTLLTGLLLVIGYSLPSRHRLPWERLIEEESATRKRLTMFFSLFIDVPMLSSSITRRPYLSWLLTQIPYAHRNTFVYLYCASLFRSELGGILIRILVIGGFVIYLAADAAGLSGWGAEMAVAVFSAVFALQLGGLSRVYRYSVWRYVYPLSEEQQTEQLIQVDRVMLTTGLLLLWLASCFPLVGKGLYVPPLTALLILIGYISIRPSRLRKKLKAEADEE